MTHDGFHPNPQRARRKSPLPPIPPNDELRRGLILATDALSNALQTLDTLLSFPLPTESVRTLRNLHTRLAATLGAMVQVEEGTRPKLTPNEDVAYLKSLFSLPDQRNESPLEQ